MDEGYGTKWTKIELFIHLDLKMHPRTWTSLHTALHVLVLHILPGHQQFLHGSWCRLLPASKKFGIVVKKDFFYINLYNVMSLCYHLSHNNTFHVVKMLTYVQINIWCRLKWTYLSPLFVPFLSVSPGFLQCPLVTLQVLRNVTVSYSSSVVTIVQFEQPPLHSQVLCYQLSQTLMELYTDTININ